MFHFDVSVVLVGLIAAVPPSLVAWFAHIRMGRELRGIHTAVNSRLDAALATIADLEKQLRERGRP